MNQNSYRLDYLAFAKQFYGDQDFEYMDQQPKKVLQKPRNFKIYERTKSKNSRRASRLQKEIQKALPNDLQNLPQLKGRVAPKNFKVNLEKNEYVSRPDEKVEIEKSQRQCIPNCMKKFTFEPKPYNNVIIENKIEVATRCTDIFRKQNVLLTKMKQNIPVKVKDDQTIFKKEEVLDLSEENVQQNKLNEIQQIQLISRQQKSQKNIKRTQNIQTSPVRPIDTDTLDNQQHSLLMHSSNSKLNHVINILINQLKYFAEKYDDSNQEVKRKLIINKCQKYETLTTLQHQLDKLLSKVRTFPSKYGCKYAVFLLDFQLIKQISNEMIELSSIYSFHVEKATQKCQSCMDYCGLTKQLIMQQIGKFNLIKDETLLQLQQTIKSQVMQLRKEKRTNSDFLKTSLISQLNPTMIQLTEKKTGSEKRTVLFPCGCSVCQNCIDNENCPICGVQIEKQVEAGGYQTTLLQKLEPVITQCMEVLTDAFELIYIQELE